MINEKWNEGPPKQADPETQIGVQVQCVKRGNYVKAIQIGMFEYVQLLS